MFGGVQQLEILLHRRCFGRALEQLVIGHPESSRRVHVMHVFVVEEGSWFSHKGINHMTKVDRFFAAPEQPRHPFDTLILVPQFEVVLMNTHLKGQSDVLAVDGIDISFHSNDAVGFHGHRQGRVVDSSLSRQWIQGRNFFTEPLLSGCIAIFYQLTNERQIVVRTIEVTASAEPQLLVKCVLPMTMG